MTLSVHEQLRVFVEEREWSQFHSPENLAKSIVIEAAELLECFQWADATDRERVKEVNPPGESGDFLV